MAENEKPETQEPEPTEEVKAERESKAWPPPGLQNKTLPKPSGEK